MPRKSHGQRLSMTPDHQKRS
ncbi:unnamed protein product [Gulo gulo]|uniref:Uncharacterized protein n=1 Tax=Gulo gulo TaxID=48420 RepID=A0A9X9LX73_GULGU|nr:unnamed protein product [Gulo gulo]